MRRENVLGNVYGRLTVIDDSFKDKPRKVLCRCSCEDKTEKMVILNRLRGETTRSCGCLKRKTKYRKDYYNNSLYQRFADMKQRCYNKKDTSYHNYGGRGIKVCDEWLNSFDAFYNWCLENGYEEGLQIDRIDNDGNYEPSNCRFVTCQENILNQRKRKNNTSGYRGVKYHPRDKTFYLKIEYNRGIVYSKAGFETAKNAAIYRDKYIVKYNLPHKLNFPKNKNKYAEEIKKGWKEELCKNFNRLGFICVYEHGNKYRYEVTYKDKTYREYGFKTAKEAAIARDRYIIENNLPNKLNF